MNEAIIPAASIEQCIFMFRGNKVMLSRHLAELYDVAPRVLVQALKRNTERFPEDFMFQLTDEEFQNLKSQVVTSSWGGLRRATPYAFTEQGVAMLSSVLRSPQAIQVNIAVMRTFVRLRNYLATHKELATKLVELEHKIGTHDKQIQSIFEAIRQLMASPDKPKRRIGFHTE
ncbi:MAG: ORF6N domain-containing protein [Candidatus Aureabacteria bacterium]|nr:ORF6N domain-containing protein [Candidatus Auribacterota bacterium]